MLSLLIYTKQDELKACRILNKDKNKLFRATNGLYRFGVIVNQKYVLNEIFNSKKDKQRYLDYVYELAVKNALVDLIYKSKIVPSEFGNIYFFVDEHTTATNGRYELR